MGKISKLINDTHSDIKVSPMAIQRYKDYRDSTRLVTLQKSGEIDSITDYLAGEMLKKGDEIINKLNNIVESTEELLNSAIKDNASYKDLVSIKRELRESMKQQIDTLQSVMNYGVRRIREADRGGERKAQTMNILIVELGENLCDNCKAVLLEKLKNL